MDLDVFNTDSGVKPEESPRTNELSLNERLYACEEYRTEIFEYLRDLEVFKKKKKKREFQNLFLFDFFFVLYFTGNIFKIFGQ